MISCSFYWALLFSSFADIKRKDFWEMFIHHIVTILLIVLSWTCNLVRIGTLVLIIHDCADVFLETAKMMKYIKWQRTCDTLFGIFTITWITTRLCIYPFWLLNRWIKIHQVFILNDGSSFSFSPSHSTCFGAKKILPMYPAYYIFNSLLLMLLGLHIVWTYFILKVLYRAILAGQVGILALSHG